MDWFGCIWKQPKFLNVNVKLIEVFLNVEVIIVVKVETKTEGSMHLVFLEISTKELENILLEFCSNLSSYIDVLIVITLFC